LIVARHPDLDIRFAVAARAFACYRACFVGTLRGFCVRFAPHHLHNALSPFFCVFVTLTTSDTRICLCAAPFVFLNVRSQTPHHRWYPQRNYFVRFVATTTDDPVYRLFYNFVCFLIDGVCSTVRAWPLNCLYLLAPHFIYACTWASLIGRPSVARAVWKTAATIITTFDAVLSHRFHFRCGPLQAIVIATRAHIAVTSLIDSPLLFLGCATSWIDCRRSLF
jgi:hypothetical protein